MKPSSLSQKMIRRQVTRTRRDIADWKRALTLAERVNEPRFYQLIDIYNEIADDALLSSQINNRFERTIARQFELIVNGKVDEQATNQLRHISIMQDLIKAILESELYGISLVELSMSDNQHQMSIINRRNIDPINARVYFDALQPNYADYRLLPEYGAYILEFNAEHIGLLNKCVPHILFKKFAQSCWSELCEIYGIPPRFIKTNTSDPEMLDRAEQMVSEMGAAAGFVIDTTEEFQFAQGTSTNGDVYNNLIRLCSNEISMLISGAILGQDTANGNYSREESNSAILARLIESDQRMVEMYMNSIVLPAMRRIGWLNIGENAEFHFSAVEDNDKLWQMAKEIMPYKEIDNEWLTEKFGIPVADKEQGLTMSANNTDKALRFFV